MSEPETTVVAAESFVLVDIERVAPSSFGCGDGKVVELGVK